MTIPSSEPGPSLVPLPDSRSCAPFAKKQRSVPVSPFDAPQGALGEAEGCHSTWGPAGEGGLDRRTGCLVSPVPLSRGQWDNAAVNAPDGDLWVL